MSFFRYTILLENTSSVGTKLREIGDALEMERNEQNTQRRHTRNQGIAVVCLGLILLSAMLWKQRKWLPYVTYGKISMNARKI